MNLLQHPPERLAELCRAHAVRKLSVFGSALKGTARADSDLDLLVEFEEGRAPGLIGLASMADELSGLLGAQVDLRTPRDLSRHFRDEVVRTAQPLYVARGSGAVDAHARGVRQDPRLCERTP